MDHSIQSPGDLPQDALMLEGEKPTHYEVRAWPRLVAKCIDVIIFYGLGLILIMVASLSGVHFFRISIVNSLMRVFEGPALLFIFSVLIWLWKACVFPLLEGFLISSYSTTPGKALLGIHLKHEDDTKLSLATSINRSYAAMAIGLWFFVPYLWIFAPMLGLKRLAREGVARWDAKRAVTYISQPVHAWRWCLACMPFILYLSLVHGPGLFERSTRFVPYAP